MSTEATTEPRVLWKPNPGPQYRFLASSARECLYGGAAGGGKTDGLLMGAARYFENPNMRSILFRKTFPMLSKIIDRSRQLYPALGGRYNQSSHIWRFPKGGFVRFANLAKPADCDNYQGDDFTYIAFDEVTQWGTSYEWDYMRSRLRTTADSGIKVLCQRGATNPGGRGHHWVKERFAINDAGDDANSIEEKTGFRRQFIAARLRDNPFYAGTDYERDLRSLSPDLQKALLDGRWDIIAGAMFDCFNPRSFETDGGHVCKPFDIPPGIEVWRGGDDGFNAPASVLWFAKIDGRTFVIRELYRAGMTTEVMAAAIREIDEELGRPGISGIMDSAAFADTGMGDSAGQGRAQKMNAFGCKWKPCAKGLNARIAGVNLVRSGLTTKLADGKPSLVFFSTCKQIIRTLPALPKDEDNPEDVDTEAEDHGYDSLRYGLQWKRSELRTGKLTGT